MDSVGKHAKTMFLGLLALITLILVLITTQASLAVEFNCCVDSDNNICVDNPSSCDGTGQTYYPGVFCGAVLECRTGCCCATPAAPNPDLWNSEESNMLMNSMACDDLGSNYDFTELDGTCVATCTGGGGGGGPPTGDTHTVDGTITDETPEELEGVTVSIPGSGTSPTTTDEDGYYVISDVPEMSIQVFATKEGCTPTYSSATSIDTDTTIDFSINCEAQACEPSAPGISAAAVQGDDSALLTITFDDVCQQLTNYYLVPKIGSNFETTENEVLVEGLLPEREYCWKVAANLGGKLHPDSIEDYDEACITTGVEECMSAGDNIKDLEWCDNSEDTGPRVLRCDDQNQITEESCPNDQVCSFVGTGDDRRRACVLQPECAECNGLFGLLKNIVFGIFHNGAATSCDSADLEGYCFEDRTSTTTDKKRSCGEVTSCEDYNGLAACEENPCEAPGNCNWLGVYTELGLGVCQASDADAACEKCEDIFGFCNQDLCESIGSANTPSDCYWDGSDNGLQYTEGFGSRCIHRDEMACRFYDTQADCTNSGSNVEIDVGYDSNDFRKAGTHTVSGPSNDLYSIGLCAWEPSDKLVDADGFCYKDADNKPSTEKKDDCRETDAFIEYAYGCLKDNEPPLTQLLIPTGTVALHELAFLEYTVQDNLFPAEEIETRFCITEGTDCYPDKTIAEAVAEVDLDVGSTESYLIKYYSWDPAGNLEVVQEHTATILNMGYPILAGAELR